jgi:hypothetical protein
VSAPDRDPSRAAALSDDVARLLGEPEVGGVERSTVLALAEPYQPAQTSQSDHELEALFRDSAALQWLPLLDARRRPIAVASRFGADEVVRRAATCVLGTTPVRDALARALTRLASARFDPLLCCDELGHYQGVVRVERMMEAVLGAPR